MHLKLPGESPENVDDIVAIGQILDQGKIGKKSFHANRVIRRAGKCRYSEGSGEDHKQKGQRIDTEQASNPETDYQPDVVDGGALHSVLRTHQNKTRVHKEKYDSEVSELANPVMTKRCKEM